MALKRKLIEVALPLEAINKESGREKSIRHGHPSTLHLYWARRPLATARAVLFAQLVDDPSSHPERFPDEVTQRAERERLHRLIERLVVWENLQDEKLLAEAFREIAAEPVNLSETRSCGNYCAGSSLSSGLLIHTVSGSWGGSGALRTNRSGWAR